MVLQMSSLELKLALAWAFAVTLAHFLLTYAFDPRYTRALQVLLSKILGAG